MKILLGIVLAAASLAVSGEMRSVALDSVANAARVDETAADSRGGWLDLGSNDLRVLPSGNQTVARIPFNVPACTGECHRTALVLGRKGEEESELKMPAGVRGQRLYLLHAIAGGPAPQKKEIVARLEIKYRDGGKVERRLRTGRDAADWIGGRGYANAVRGWTAYNRNTQVSLFVSAFELDEKREVGEIGFKAEGKCPWMVIAATVGDKVEVRGLQAKKPLRGTYVAPPPRTAPLAVFPEGKRPKNIILVIGDGMGQGALRLASLYQHGRDDALYTQQLPFAGLCTTFSASSPVTDSAASGTAIATGTKTSNGTLGLRIAMAEDRGNPQRLVSVAEKAHAAGLSVALVTSDSCTGATPAAFYAHVAGRGEMFKVAEQAAASGYEVIVGRGNRKHFLPNSVAGGERRDGRNLIGEMEQAGYASVEDQAAFDAVPASQKVIGLFKSFDGEQSIAAAVKIALRHVGEAPKGFFMMAECATTDHGGHGNDPSVSVLGVMQVDWMVKAAVEFAEARGDTLVVVTADHETGGISALRGANGKIVYSHATTSHSGAPVAVYAYGPGAERFGREIDNTDIGRTFKELLGVGD